MSIAFDASTPSSWSSSGRTSHTYAHTCTGSDRLLLVGIGSFDSTGGTKVTGITYAGVSMIYVDTLQIQSNVFIDLYKLVNPASGANNVVISFSTSQTFGWTTATSYTGAGDPNVNVKQLSTGSSPTTITLTTVTNNSWLAMFAFDNNSAPQPSTGTTERSDASRGAAMDSNGPLSPVGNYSLVFTHASATSAGAIMVAIPPVSSTPTPRRLMMMGVGM